MVSELLGYSQHTCSFRSVTVPSIWPPASLLAGLTMSPMNCTQGLRQVSISAGPHTHTHTHSHMRACNEQTDALQALLLTTDLKTGTNVA